MSKRADEIIEQIQRKHEDLIVQNEEVSGDVTFIADFLEEISRAGEHVGSMEGRSDLRAKIRYWAGVMDSKTGTFPFVDLHPYKRDSLPLTDSPRE